MKINSKLLIITLNFALLTIFTPLTFHFSLFTFSLASAATINRPPSYLSSNNGLVGYWTMDGNKVNWATGAVTDSSGKGNTGTITNMATSTGVAAGKIGQALNFDGGNDYVSTGTNNRLTAVMTATAWINTNSVAAATKLIIGESRTTSAGFNYGITINNVAGKIGCIWGSGILVNSDSAVQVGQWNHVAIVRTGSTGAWTCTIYINGSANGNTNTITNPTGSSAATRDIGRSPVDASTQYFNGLIDEVRVYNRALGANEVATLYNSGAAKLVKKAIKPITATVLTSGTGIGSSSDTTASFAPSANALVLAFVYTLGNGSTQVPTMSGNGLTWVRIYGPVDWNGDGTASVFRAMGPAPSSGAATISYSVPSSSARWVIIEFANVDTSGTNGSGAIVQSGVTAAYGGTSVTHTLGAFSSTDNATVGGIFHNSPTQPTAGSGFTLLGGATSASRYVQPEWKVTNDTTVDASGTSANWLMWAAEIKAKPRSTTINVSPTKYLTDGLVGYWTFDGKDTPWTSATAATTVDKSGSGNTGTLTNMSQASSPAIGRIGQALNFDGVDDVVNAGSNSSLDDLGPMTASAWIYAKSSGEGGLTGRIFDKCATGSANCWTFLQTTGNVGGLRFFVDGAPDMSVISSNNVIQYNRWHHVLATWDGSMTAANVHIYVDGNEVSYGTQTNGGTRNSDAASTLRIGNTVDADRTWDGLIDEVRVYNRALSPDEIKRLYNIGR